MLFTAQLIELAGAEPLAKGTVRSVFAFPGQPDLLIKVFTRPDQRVNHRFAKRLSWWLFPDARFRSILKELECELLVSLKLGARIGDMPLSKMLGVVQTDRGPGVVVERISGSDGSLALQLNRLCRKKQVTGAVLDELNEFVRKVFDLHIVARDIKSSNIVYGTRDSTPAFFLIDGYGERNLVPLRSWSRLLNDRSLNKQFAQIAQKTGLIWHADRRSFSTG